MQLSRPWRKQSYSKKSTDRTEPRNAAPVVPIRGSGRAAAGGVVQLVDVRSMAAPFMLVLFLFVLIPGDT